MSLEQGAVHPPERLARLDGHSLNWARFSEGVCGAKLHVVYDPDADRPIYAVVTAATSVAAILLPHVQSTFAAMLIFAQTLLILARLTMAPPARWNGRPWEVIQPVNPLRTQPPAG